MLDRLRQQVASETRPHKLLRRKRVSRTICVPLSADLYKLRSSWDELVPDSNLLTKVKPWLDPVDDIAAFSKLATEAVDEAFLNVLAQELARDGISLRPINLVVVLGDLNEANLPTILAERCRVLEEIIRRVTVAQSPFFWVGIFLADSNAVQGQPQGWGSLFGQRFIRTLLLDERNSSGRTLNALDREHLILHALHFLDRVPDSHEHEQLFAEWLQQSSSSEGFVSAIGGCRVFFPVDQVMELGAVQCSAQLLHDALLSTPEQQHYAFYKNHLLQELSLVNLPDLASLLRVGIPNPLTTVTEGTGVSGQLLLDALSRIDSSLPVLVGLHEAALARAMPDRLASWRQSVEDHLDSIISSEIGGFVVARRFIDEVAAHARSMLGVAPQSSLSDTGESFREAQQALTQLPEDMALAARGLLGSLATAAVANTSSASQLARFGLMLGMPVTILGFAALLRHSRNTQWERSLSKLRGSIDHKWEALIEGIVNRVSQTLLENFAEHLDRIREELDQAVQRTRDVVAWLRNEYTPSLFQPSAVLWPLLQTRVELLEFAKTCRPETIAPLSELVGPGSMLWRRLDTPGTSPPNAFEWDLIEDAALRSLPNCRHLGDTKLLAVLEQDGVLCAQTRQQLLLCAEPYLALRAGSGEPDSSALLEAEPLDGDTVLPSIQEELNSHFRRVACLPRSSPYSLALTSVLERVHFSCVFPEP